MSAFIPFVPLAAALGEAHQLQHAGGVDAVDPGGIQLVDRVRQRAQLLGHLQRGGAPTSFDRMLCSVFGAYAVELIDAGDFGKMVAWQGSQVGAIPIRDAVGRLKAVRPEGNLVRTAQALGISLGD